MQLDQIQPSTQPPLDPFLQDAKTKQRLLKNDTALLYALYEKNARLSRITAGMPLDQFRQILSQKKTLSVPIIRWHSVQVDGQKRQLALVAATNTETNHGEMSSMLYLRDHIQTARVYMELSLRDPRAYMIEKRVGRDLILSALHLLSTPFQLERFRTVIQKDTSALQEEWPHISLWFDDLQSEKPNGWRNKQDSFQMLAHLTLDAIERGYISADELLPSHRTFLSLIVPFLKSIGFPRYESSGSWEEITAVRTSVIAVETALLHKIKTLAPKHPFLKENTPSFDNTITDMLHTGLVELGLRLPNESPNYPTDSVKYREADAALVYVLMYGLPQLLTEAKVPVNGQPRTVKEIEDVILAALHTLDDPLTGGVLRYHGDSYQRVNFHTNTVQATVHGIKRFVQDKADNNPVDLDLKQSLRNQLTPQGREAAWTHPLGQIAAWAAKRYLESETEGDRKHYKAVRDTYLHRMIGTITVPGQWHTVLNPTGQYELQEVPAWRLPECCITYQLPSKEPLVVPSPHTPLNWSSASLKEALGLAIHP